jgi:hypothetical protein
MVQLHDHATVLYCDILDGSSLGQVEQQDVHHQCTRNNTYGHCETVAVRHPQRNEANVPHVPATNIVATPHTEEDVPLLQQQVWPVFQNHRVWVELATKTVCSIPIADSAELGSYGTVAASAGLRSCPTMICVGMVSGYVQELVASGKDSIV